MIVTLTHFIFIVCNKTRDTVLTILMVKQVVVPYRMIYAKYQVLTAVWLTTEVFWNAILKDHYAYILGGKQSKNQSNPLGLPTLKLFHVYLTPMVSQMKLINPIHLMQPSVALNVHLHALVINADFPSDVTYLVMYIIVQSTSSNILLCKMTVAGKWIWMEEISELQQQQQNHNSSNSNSSTSTSTTTTNTVNMVNNPSDIRSKSDSDNPSR